MSRPVKRISSTPTQYIVACAVHGNVYLTTEAYQQLTFTLTHTFCPLCSLPEEWDERTIQIPNKVSPA